MSNIVDMKTIREIRLYHWQEHLKNELHAKHAKTYTFPHKKHKAKATFHLAAVQALNDLFEAGDTAEKDAARINQINAHIKTSICLRCKVWADCLNGVCYDCKLRKEIKDEE